MLIIMLIIMTIYRFLAPTGAQLVTLSVCLSVRLSGASLSRAVNLWVKKIFFAFLDDLDHV